MKSFSYSAVRQKLAKVMEEVCDDYAPVVITRQNADSVVMMSLAEYESLEETLYLLRSPKNAARLAESIAQIETGKAKKRKLIEPKG
jgi:antitoxin YefM